MGVFKKEIYNFAMAYVHDNRKQKQQGKYEHFTQNNLKKGSKKLITSCIFM